MTWESIFYSEFLWGVVVGALVSLIGAYYQISVQQKKLLAQQKKDVSALARDVVRNLMQVADEIAEARRRSNVIHHDLLYLVDVEIGVYGKNREHMIRLDDPLRSELRRYITQCALRKNDVTIRLSMFDDEIKRANSLRAAGDAAAAQDVDQRAAPAILQQAHRAMDDMLATIR